MLELQSRSAISGTTWIETACGTCSCWTGTMTAYTLFLNDNSPGSVGIGDPEVEGCDDTSTLNDIVDGTVTGDDIQDASVTSIDIANGTISSTDIKNGTITGTDIADESIVLDRNSQTHYLRKIPCPTRFSAL